MCLCLGLAGWLVLVSTYTHDEVQICQVSADIRQAVVVDKNVKDSIQVEEQETIRKAVVHAQEDDDGLGEHDPQGHGRDELHLLDHVHLLLGDCNLFGVLGLVLLDGVGDDNARQRLREEAHADSKGGADDDVDPEDPRKPHVDIVGDPLSHRRADGRARVGRGDKQGHGLSGAVRVAKQVGNGAGDIAQGHATSSSAEELEDDEHGQVQGLRTADVEDGIDEYGDDVNPFPATNITARVSEAVSIGYSHSFQNGRQRQP